MTRSTVVDIHGWQTQTRDWWIESGIIELRNNARAKASALFLLTPNEVSFYE